VYFKESVFFPSSFCGTIFPGAKEMDDENSWMKRFEEPQEEQEKEDVDYEVMLMELEHK